MPGNDLERPRRRHLGGARTTAPFHALEVDGLGGDGPSRQGYRAIRDRGTARQMAPCCATGSTIRSATTDSTRSWDGSCSRMGARNWTRACCRYRCLGSFPEDPRVRGTIAAIEKRLLRGGFVDRYETRSGVDGRPPGEGAFSPCSFWLADNYVLQGRHEEARALFERLGGLSNDVGYSRRNTSRSTSAGCNFPQAFSHVSERKVVAGFGSLGGSGEGQMDGSNESAPRHAVIGPRSGGRRCHCRCTPGRFRRTLRRIRRKRSRALRTTR